MNKWSLEKDLIDLLGEETFEETYEEAHEELFTEMAGISLYKYYKDKEKEKELKMTLDKRLVDEVIRLTKKYHKSNDIDYLPTLLEAKKVLEENATWQVGNLLYDLAQYTQVSGKGTYDDIYKALAIFGIIVEDKEIENDKERTK